MKETEMKRVPKLRFPEFTDDWEQRKLGEILEFHNGFNGGADRYGAGIPLISVMDILNNNFITSENIRSRADMNEIEFQRFKVEYGDVLFQRSSENIEDAGTSNVYMDKHKNAVFGGFVICGKKKAEYKPLFMRYELTSKNVRTQIISKAQGAQHINVSQDTLQGVEISMPSQYEQEKIGVYFSNIDHLITLHQRKLKKLNVLKKGVMQKLFSQEVRFKVDDGSEFPEWEKKPFGDVVSEFKVKTKVEDEDTLLSCAINGMFLNSELFGHQRGQSNIGYLKIKKGTLILSAQNLHLGNANVNLRFEHGIISPAYKTYDIVGCSAEYMSQWAKWDMTKQFFYNATTVGASECRRNVDWNMLYSQLFAVPCLAEQQKIADCLSSLDEVIEKQKATLAAWEELKKGLLQQMFV